MCWAAVSGSLPVRELQFPHESELGCEAGIENAKNLMCKFPHFMLMATARHNVCGVNLDKITEEGAISQMIKCALPYQPHIWDFLSLKCCGMFITSIETHLFRLLGGLNMRQGDG